MSSIRRLFADPRARACLLALLVLGFCVRPVVIHLGGLHGLEHALHQAHGHVHGDADPHAPLLAHGDGVAEVGGGQVHHAGHDHLPGHGSEDGAPQGQHLLLHMFECTAAMELPLALLELPASLLAVPLPSHDWSTAPEQRLSSPFRPPIAA